MPEDCRRLTDFETEAEQLGWRVTLDGVMGGLSSGDVAFDDSAMIFTGEIVTDGGGFSLLRTPMGGDEFGDASHLVVRLRTDGRGYEMVFKDDGDQRLFHEAKVPSADSGDWQEVRVELSGLIATANGRLVDAPAFNPATVSETGIILKDGIDGSFELEIDWIDACR